MLHLFERPCAPSPFASPLHPVAHATIFSVLSAASGTMPALERSLPPVSTGSTCQPRRRSQGAKASAGTSTWLSWNPRTLRFGRMHGATLPETPDTVLVPDSPDAPIYFRLPGGLGSTSVRTLQRKLLPHLGRFALERSQGGDGACALALAKAEAELFLRDAVAAGLEPPSCGLGAVTEDYLFDDLFCEEEGGYPGAEEASHIVLAEFTEAGLAPTFSREELALHIAALYAMRLKKSLP